MSRSGAKLKRVTRGKGIAGVLDRTKKAAVKVGVLKGTGAHPNGDGQTVAEIAFWNEFGTRRIPPRPFLRATLNAEKSNYRKLFKMALSQVLQGRTSSDRAVGIIGLKVQADIQQTITALSTPANSPMTIALKDGKSNPLVDSGKLRGSISWVLIK